VVAHERAKRTRPSSSSIPASATRTTSSPCISPRNGRSSRSTSSR
jgi:hypothetical protein